MENWKLERLKYCRIERVNGELKYYVMDGKHPVEVTKDVYLVIEHSYHKEWLMQHGKHSNWVSLEQIAEDEESIDRHGRMSSALEVPSAENMYFAPAIEKQKQRMIEQLKTEIDNLQDEQKNLVLSHVEDNGIINNLAERDCVTDRAIYLRRDTVCRGIARKLMEADEDE